MKNRAKILQALSDKVGYPIIDHWQKKGSRDAIYLYPYPCSLKDFKKLIEFCEEHRLYFYVSGSEEYGHGTFEIKITDIEDRYV